MTSLIEERRLLAVFISEWSEVESSIDRVKEKLGKMVSNLTAHTQSQ